MFRRFSSLLMLVGILLWPQLADAQVHHHHSGYSPGYHVDHHDHVVRDSHGHVIGRYHHDVVHENSTYVVPHAAHGDHHGTYYSQDDNYYYVPRTSSTRITQTAYKPVTVEFGGFSHVDDLASRLETLTNELCLDLHYNYRHNRGFNETYREAYQVFEVAKFIHAAEHQQDRRAIQERLQGLDELFHHVQDDVRGWSRHHVRQIGQLGILSKMDMIESTLHHLMNDVGVHQTGKGQQAPPPQGGGGVEQAPPPPTLP
ncbi:hypothetical protein NG895_02315 [Aeoliella sp. ICT_H6.2]|uniref:Uncharacterized protein n=1 Tax=Aeoliella straminimaris TaxID=2954799 RepID=A0A9X2JEK0_9BACT|nr:hypothetical protein [Aeoliella straminimaris]MCO6042731.1 hypothetical protein [Aeoliella straminimaris]